MNRVWTEEEVNFLKENYSKMSNIELANAMNVKTTRISDKIVKLGLKRSREFLAEIHRRNPYTFEPEFIKKRADTMRNNPNHGNWNIGRKRPDLTKRNLENNPFNNPETKRKAIEKQSIRQKEKMKDEDYKKDWLKKIRAGLKKPTLPERTLIDLIKRYELPFNYVGNGDIYFKDGNTLFNPDFLSKNPKHIIEVFGDYWHNLSERKELDKRRLETYEKYGYKTLVIWEHELVDSHYAKKYGKRLSEQEIISKINKFLIGGQS